MGQKRSVIKRGKHPSRGPSAFLVGKIYDETGDRLTPSRSGGCGRCGRFTDIRIYRTQKGIIRQQEHTEDVKTRLYEILRTTRTQITY